MKNLGSSECFDPDGGFEEELELSGMLGNWLGSDCRFSVVLVASDFIYLLAREFNSN